MDFYRQQRLITNNFIEYVKQFSVINILNEDNYELFKMIVSGNEDCAIKFLGLYPECINAQDSNGFTPIMLSVLYKMDTLTQVLLLNGARLDTIDSFGNDVLYYSLVEKDAALSQQLIDSGCCINWGHNILLKTLV